MALQELRKEIKSWVRKDFDTIVDFLNIHLELSSRESSETTTLFKYKLDNDENILVYIHKRYGTICLLESRGETVRLNTKTLELEEGV